MIADTDIFNAKILIVDDQQANLILLDTALRRAGYLSVASTTDPTSVAALHGSINFDLILLDLSMPVLDGFQVMEQLNAAAIDTYTPVLVLCAEPGHKLRALKAGAKDFISKPFDLHEVLLRVYNMLGVRLLHVEATQLIGRLKDERLMADQLLLNALPPSIANRLKSRPAITERGFTKFVTDSFADVTVLSADIVDSAKSTHGVSLEVMVSLLQDISERFDVIARRYGLEKVKTVGDSYLVAAGLPRPVADHASRAASMALDMMAAMKQFNGTGPYRLNLRIGMDTGAAIAGAVDARKVAYDLWGDVVITAGRMASHGAPGRIQVTDAICRRLDKKFVLEKRDFVEFSGKGGTQTWFLNSRSV